MYDLRKERSQCFAVPLLDWTIEIAAMPVDFVRKAQTPVPVDWSIGGIGVDNHTPALPSVRISQNGR